MADDKPRGEQAPESARQGRKSSGSTKVTNAAKHPVSIGGVSIGPGESAEVPGFDRDKPSMKRWVDAGVIKVG